MNRNEITLQEMLSSVIGELREGDVYKRQKTNHANHANLANYKDYGLTCRFYIPTAPYNTLGCVDGNTNKTDQQKFAKLDSHENGIMSVSYTHLKDNLKVIVKKAAGTPSAK